MKRKSRTSIENSLSCTLKLRWIVWQQTMKGHWGMEVKTSIRVKPLTLCRRYKYVGNPPTLISDKPGWKSAKWSKLFKLNFSYLFYYLYSLNRTDFHIFIKKYHRENIKNLLGFEYSSFHCASEHFERKHISFQSHNLNKDSRLKGRTERSEKERPSTSLFTSSPNYIIYPLVCLQHRSIMFFDMGKECFRHKVKY